MKRLICLVLALVLLGAAAIAVDGLRDNAQASDVGIVLGSKVMLDGTPSERLRARLDKAAELYRQGMFKHIIVSGGTGVEGYSEARVMADYLAGQQAIPRTALLLDKEGNDRGDGPQQRRHHGQARVPERGRHQPVFPPDPQPLRAAARRHRAYLHGACQLL